MGGNIGVMEGSRKSGLFLRAATGYPESRICNNKVLGIELGNAILEEAGWQEIININVCTVQKYMVLVGYP
jgi:hypothetical protein